MKHLLLTLLLASISFIGRAQFPDSVLYNEANYKEVGRGYNGMVWVIRKQFQWDPAYTFEKTGLDSLYSDTGFFMKKMFLYKGVGEGPYYVYSKGSLERQGWLHNFHYHGPHTDYRKGKVYETGNYANGKRVGLWTKYHDNGAVFVKRYYRADGTFIRLELHDRAGKLYKTEYEDSGSY